jgi:hypothetical protein
MNARLCHSTLLSEALYSIFYGISIYRIVNTIHAMQPFQTVSY